MTYLLDTNVVSEFVSSRPDVNVVRWLHDLQEDDAHISVITLAELRRGIELLTPGSRKSALSLWYSDDLPRRFEKRIIDVTPPIANAWGEIMAEARQGGIVLSVMDGFLAATAQAHSLVLVTRNTKDFKSLRVEIKNPWQA